MTKNRPIEINYDPAPFNAYLQLVNANKIPEFRKYIEDQVMAAYERCFSPTTHEPDYRKIKREIETIYATLNAKISQIRSNPNFSGNQVESRTDFNRSQRTIAKLLQELLSDLPDYQQNPKIEDVVISPEKLTDTMLHNLGLFQFIPESGTGKAAAVEFRAQAIPYIKKVFSDNLEPISLLNDGSRNGGKPKHAFRLFRINGENPNEGMVLGTQNDSNCKTIFLTDLFGAYRRIDHIHEGYQNETEALTKIAVFLKSTTQDILKKWPEIKESGGLKEITRKIAEFVDSLEFVRNEYKVEIKRRLQRCNDFEDSKGRLNPGSRLAIFAPILDFIAGRKVEIRHIRNNLSHDQSQIWDRIGRDTAYLESFSETVSKYGDRIKIIHPEKQLNDQEKNKIICNLLKLEEDCERFEFEPFLSIGRKIIEESERIISILKSNGDDMDSRRIASQSFVRIFSMAKIIESQRRLSGIRHKFFPPGRDIVTVNRGELNVQLKEVRKFLLDKQIADNLKVDDFLKVYGGLLNHLNGMIGVLTKEFIHAKNRTGAIKSVMRQLSEFDLHKLVRTNLFQTTPLESHLSPPQTAPSSSTYNTPPHQS